MTGLKTKKMYLFGITPSIMYKFLLLVVIFLSYLSISAQTTKTFICKSRQKAIEDILFTEIYTYPELKPADILLKDGTVARASVNYNSLYGEM